MDADPKAWARVQAAGAAAFSRDGATLLHLRGAGLAQIWALDLACGAARQLTHHDERVAFLRRAPTDDRILYGIDAGGDERQQLWLLEGEASRPLTAAPAVMHDFGAWMPAGDAVACAANERTEAHLDVCLLPLDGGPPRRLHEGDGMTAVAAASADGATLAVIAERSSFDMSLWLLDVAGGGARELPRPGPTRYQSVRWMPDGRLLALTDAAGPADASGRDMLALCRLDPATGAAEALFAPAGRDVEAYALSADGTLLATVENDRGHALLRLGPTADAERPLLTTEGVAADLAFSPDGRRLAFTLSTPTTPAALWLWEAGTTRPLWQPVPPAPPVPFALVSWTSFDGREIPGWLALPPGAAPPGGHPAVVWVHGGPVGQTRAGFRPDMQALLAQGYAVLMPNVRGSSGYGRAAALSDERERRLDSVTDLARGAAWLAARPDVDAARIAVSGQSYGGYMVLAAITEHPELWRCAIDFYGIADFRTLLAGTGSWRRRHRADEYGDPSRQAGLMERISPITHVDHITAPLLVLHGTRDPRVPIGESERIVAALRERGRPVRYEVFDYAGHGFVRPDDKARVYAAVAEFLDRSV